MRILFYIHPLIHPLAPLFNAGWATTAQQFIGPLRASRQADIRIIVPSRFLPYMDEHHRGAIVPIDELALHRSLKDVRPDHTPSDIDRSLRHDADPELAATIGHQVAESLGGFVPDLVISVSQNATFLKASWPDATILHLEQSAFSRLPFGPSYTLDPFDCYDRSLVSRTDVHKRFRDSPSSLVSTVRQRYRRHVTDHNPISELEHIRGSDCLLVPLQVSGFHSFDEQVNYRTQFEFLLDVATSIPANTPIFVTEYASWGPVIRDEGFFANRKFIRHHLPNVVFLDRTKDFPFISQYLIGLCRAV